MSTPVHNLLLADDDADDCMLFKEALEALSLTFNLDTVNDGVQLMRLLQEGENVLPDVLFLDLNMPRKTGLECLTEIKMNEKLKSLPVIIYSTSFDHIVIDELYEKGAHLYIRKPGDFSKLKQVILESLTLTLQNNPPRPAKENFVIQV